MYNEMSVQNKERGRFSWEKLPEFISLCFYILFRKVWRVQTIFALPIIFLVILFLTLFYYDARLRSEHRHKIDKVQVRNFSHLYLFFM